MKQCPCGNTPSYDECCGAIISGKIKPETAEQTMRARYSAYAKHEIDYIETSHHPETRHEFNREDISNWSKKATWDGLEILRTQAGEANDNEGIVGFIARYTMDGKPVEHQEVSQFKKQDGDWYFYDGSPVPQTYRRDEAKVGRNDPCSCGSGKKFKRCCG